MVPAGSHFPLLAACAARSRGPVLELGCGFYSTPLLHFLCRGRRILTLETDPGWLSKFRDLEDGDHSFHHVGDWGRCEIPESREWGLTFVDNRPVTARTPLIRRLKDRSRLIVVHDTEDRIYKYETVLPEFKYRYDYKRFRPWTTVVSMVREFEP